MHLNDFLQHTVQKKEGEKQFRFPSELRMIRKVNSSWHFIGF